MKYGVTENGKWLGLAAHACWLDWPHQNILKFSSPAEAERFVKDHLVFGPYTIQEFPTVRTNLVALVTDHSASMLSVRAEALAGAKHLLGEYKKRAAEPGQTTLYTRIGFADRASVESRSVDPRTLPDPTTYPCNGHTALWDAFGLAIETLSADGARKPDPAYFVLVWTDGEENQSYRHNVHTIKKLLAECEAAGNWTVAVMVPSEQAKQKLVTYFNFPEGNVHVWEVTKEGTQEATEAAAGAIDSYYTARSLGEKSVKQVFSVKTDLSHLDVSKLADVSKRFTSHVVGKEEAVKDFVEAVTGRAYVRGEVYYQLTKPEKVQGYKGVLVRPKGKRKVYGGNEARKLIGLPVDGVSEAKVTPGNHGDFDLFVQSGTDNRKLVRGTAVLMDKTQTTPLQRTW